MTPSFDGSQGDDVLLHILVPDFATPGLDWGLGRLPRIIEGTWTIPWDGTPARDDSSEGDATPKASLVDQLGCERCPDGFDGRRGHRRSEGGTAAAGLAVGAGLKMREVLVAEFEAMMLLVADRRIAAQLDSII